MTINSHRMFYICNVFEGQGKPQRIQPFCLQLEASCLQLSFFARNCVWELCCLQWESSSNKPLNGLSPAASRKSSPNLKSHKLFCCSCARFKSAYWQPSEQINIRRCDSLRLLFARLAWLALPLLQRAEWGIGSVSVGSAQFWRRAEGVSIEGGRVPKPS